MDPLILLIIAAIGVLILAGGITIFFLFRGRQSDPAPDDNNRTTAALNDAPDRADDDVAFNLNQDISTPDTPSDPVPSSLSQVHSTPKPSMSSSFSMPEINPDEVGKIRIMIIDDNEETIQHVTRLLYFEDDIAVVGQANRGQLGIDMAKEKMPHVILMDINMPDMDGIETTRRLSDQVPYCQVIMISVQSDQEYMKRAMLAGARDYQPKPFSSDELIASVRRVYQMAQSTYQQFEVGQAAQQQVQASPEPDFSRLTAENGRIVAVYSPKGGVGTSTIAANLAAALQQKQGSVVLVDADYQFGDIMVHLNTPANRNITDLVRSEAFELELLPEVLTPHETGLNLLLAPAQPEAAETVTPAMTTALLEELRQKFETVIVDTSSLLSNHTLAILESANYVLLVIEPELPSLKNAKLFLEVVQALNLSASRIDLLINQSDKAGGINVKQVDQALKFSDSYQVPLDAAVLPSVNGGQVIVKHQAKTPFAKAITVVAESMIEKFSRETKQPEDLVAEIV
ncbi:MAG: response regulator [Chloroflexota bacterium]